MKQYEVTIQYTVAVTAADEEQAIEQALSDSFAIANLDQGNVVDVEVVKVPSFKALHGRMPQPGVDYDPEAPLSQDDYEYLFGVGRYINQVWVIWSAQETAADLEGEPLFWNNQSGWGSLVDAEHLYSQGLGYLPLPDGALLTLAEAREKRQAWEAEQEKEA